MERSINPVRWYAAHEMDSPYDNAPFNERMKINQLRWDLDIDSDVSYTLEELEEMIKEKNESE